MGLQVRWVFILVLFALLFSKSAYAGIIFQDNFDSCTQNCVSSSLSAPPGWAQWYGPTSATIGGVTHYAGEITSPGRGEKGKSFKTWRNGSSWENYNGVLAYTFSSSQSEIYMRYYVKLPKAMDLSQCTGSNYLKLWRLNTTGSAGEIYLNLNQNGGSSYNTGSLQVATNTRGLTTILNNTNLRAIWDDNWHSWEWHINLATGVLELWIDGIPRYSGSGWNFGGGTFKYVQHFSMGNHATGCNWQSTWQAMDIDDFVLSTTYVGPDGGSSGGSDTTAPSIPSGLSAGATSSSQINLSWTASTDNVGVTGYKIYRNGTYIATSAGTSYSNTGLTASTSYTYRVSAIDAAGNESSQSSSATATTLAAADTTAPSIPSGLSASATSSSQINLSWTASTDNVGVTGYKIYRSGTYIATSTGTSYSNTGLTASTSYTYRVSAIDAAGNESSQSSSVSATTQAATTGGTVLFKETFDNNSFSSRGWYDNTTHGTVVSGGQSGNSLQWAWAQGATRPTNGAAMRKKITPTDSLYVSFYVKFQTGWRGSQKTYHPHMILIPSDLDSDYAGLANNYLNTYIEFSADTSSPYTIRPLLGIQDQMRVNTSNGTPPNNLTTVTENRSVAYCNTPAPAGANGICYAENPYYSANVWKASTASVPTNSWRHVEVYFKMNTISGGKGQANGVMQQWVDGSLVINRSDVLYRTSQDATKKWAQVVLAPWIGDGSPIAQTMWLDELTVATSPPSSGGDTQAPTTPSSLTASAVSSSQINLSWPSSTDNVGVTGYKIYRSGTYLATSTGTSYSNTGLTASTSYSYKVSAIDAAGNESSQSSTATATTLAPPDTTAPSIPSGLSASATSSSEIGLSWTASTDNVGVTGYKIYRSGTYLATSTGTSYTDKGLTASTSYSYKVSAIDAAGNESSQSSTATATTKAAADTTAPSIPSGLSASATSSSEIGLSWTASTDNVGVTGYKIYRSGTYLATSTGTSYTDKGLSASTSYSYKVSAIDAAGNESSQSSSASATTQADATGGAAIFKETFDDINFASRGWYDNTTHGTVVSGGKSGNSLQWAWAQGATRPTNGTAMRKKFTPTDSLYVSFYVKFQTGWRGSQKAYHPHMILIPSDLDGDYTPLANNYLNTYVEFVSDIGSPYTIRPLLGIQDQKRVNTSNGTLPNNLTAVTENRSVAYCNSPVPQGATGACYADNPYYSATGWKASTASVSTNTWHHVEVYFKMNTISDGKGQANGVMQQWIDGSPVINRSDVLYRTNQDATKKWAQFVLAPWIGDGSPIAQTMWLDELTVTTSSPYSVPLSAPTGFMIQPELHK